MGNSVSGKTQRQGEEVSHLFSRVGKRGEMTKRVSGSEARSPKERTSNVGRQDTREICKDAERNIVKNMARCRFGRGSLYAHLIL